MLVERPRLAQVMGSVALMLAGVTFAVFTLLVTLFPADHAKVAKDASTWIFASLFFIVFIECSLLALKRSLAIRGSQLKSSDESVWALLGRFFQYQDMAASVVMSVIFLAILGGVTYVIVRWAASNQLQTSTPFFLQLSIYAVYLIVRYPLMNVLRPLGASLKKQAAKNLPTYQLTQDGVAIDLSIRAIGNASRRFVVKIGFAELDEVKAFTFAEAQTYERYEIGPNIELLARQTKDLYQYMKGAIPRPTVYGLNMRSSSGTTILLRGPEIFYFITVNSPDGRDLLRAYRAFKQGSATLRQL